MPEKSVREMTEEERKVNSLSSRTFQAVLILSLILSIVAIAFGYHLYSTGVRDQYMERTTSLAQTITSLYSSDDFAEYADKVMTIYNEAPEDVRNQPDSEAYKKLFENVADEKYMEILSALNQVRINNDALITLFGVLDEDNRHFVYVMNAEQIQTGVSPGQWVQIEPKNMAFMKKGKTGATSATLRMSAGVYVCAGNQAIYSKEGRVVGNIIVAVSMDQITDRSTKFICQYIVLLAAVAIALAYFTVQNLKKEIVKPIEKLTDAATAYISDEEDTDKNYFGELEITTGDEIESLSLIMADMESDINNYIHNLTAVTAEKERISTELNLANRIQADMLPSTYPAFPEREEFDIYASMTPAKEVGGDFYDFFMIDEDHLVLVIADVSGKGIPAALFMMASKIMIQNIAFLGHSPAKVLELVNEQICKSNHEDMFVTVWMGILDVNTGIITCANAGHEYPTIRRENGNFELFKDRHGFIIGGMEGMRYRDYEIQLNPGDTIFVYTDGVAEATNTSSELFGLDRMLASLDRAESNDPIEISIKLMESINEFVGEGSQFDDITMLCATYYGQNYQRKPMFKEITVDATINNIRTVTEFVDAELEAHGCPMKKQIQIDIAIDEIFSNIAHYAFEGTGKATVCVNIEDDPKVLTMIFKDNGIPYDPLVAKDPDVTLSADERSVGGLGVFIVKKTMDDVHYTYENGQNILTIKKIL
ncbi:MAG: SpoIIE family protein phosphatase [Erysipelotrichaceae bacterium]|nr:SpoIIE family protein phosphatase [Erysipelotrichaceae bacterium]